MSNRRELKHVRNLLDTAKAILELPRRRGAKVQWDTGLIWERVGDDAWTPRHKHPAGEHTVRSSEHVATTRPWVPYIG